MDPEKVEKRKKFLLTTAYWAVLVVLLFLACKYAVPIMLPFVLGFVIALLIKPVVDFLQSKWRFPRPLASLIVVVLVCGVLGLLAALLLVRVIGVVQDLLIRLPALYNANFEPVISNMFDGVQNLIQRIDPEKTLGLDAAAEDLAVRLGALIAGWSTRAVTATAKVAVGLPKTLVHAIFTVLSTFYFVMDYKKISGFVLRQIPSRAGKVLTRGKEELGTTLKNYIRSYAIILFITFMELCVSFTILKVNNGGLWAFVVAVFDILPVVGTGVVVFPWAIVCFVQGNIFRGVGLAVTGVIVVVVRNIMEPKIVGTQVGLHPLVTLMAMFVGAYFFGGWGLLGFPVLLALMNALQREGTITFYK